MRLSTIHKSTIHKILDEAEIKPFCVRYYCENRYPDFVNKIHILLVYEQLSLHFDKDGNLIPWENDEEIVHDVSYDESLFYRLLPQHRTIFYLMKNIVQSIEITRAGGLAQCLCWQAFIFRQGKQSY